MSFGHAKNLGRIDVDDASVNIHDSFAVCVLEAAHAEWADAASVATDTGVLRLISELSDAADDHRVHTENFSDLRGGGRIGTVAIGEILLGHDLVQRVALDYGIGAVLHQILHQQVGDALADVDVISQLRDGRRWDRREVEIEYRDALLAPLSGRRRA